MQKAHDASKNDWWRNLPDITTPITQDELNRVETSVDVIDDRVVGFDLSKANQSDLLQTIKTFTYDTETGVWVFTWWNGSTLTIDQNIEKIPVSFSMSPQGIITMTTSDGTQYTCDIAALIKTYSFLDSDTIDFTDTVDSDGNHTITADIKNGSVTGEKLQPNYLADCVLAKQGAETAEANAETAEETALTHQYNAEAWAKGTKNGVPVTPMEEQYHNSAEYWAGQARAIVGDKVDSFNGRIGTVVAEDGDYPSDYIVPETGAIPGQVPVVRNVGTGQDVKLRYVNEDLDIGLKPHIIVISETGSTVTLTKGTKVIYASETSPEHFEADVTEFGTWVIDSVLSGDDAQVSLVVDAVKIYTVDDSHWHADITVTYPTGGTCSCSKSGTTTLYATGSPYTFTVHESGTYTITAIANGETYTDTVEVTTSGQTESLTIPEGSTVTPTDSVATLLSCAGIHDTSITSMSDLLADTTTLLAVINSNNAIDYLVRSKSFAGVSAVPVMTDYTTPSGEVIYYASVSGSYTQPPWRCFNPAYTNGSVDRANGAYIGYDFINPTVIRKASADSFNLAQASTSATLSLIASNDKSDWTTLHSETVAHGASFEFIVDNSTAYRYYAIKFTNITATGVTNICGLANLKFCIQDADLVSDSTAMSYIGLNNYAANTLLADSDWRTAICNSTYFESVLNVKIPTMTSASAPSGNVYAISSSSGREAYHAFDNVENTWWNPATTNLANAWIEYAFPEAKHIYKIAFKFYNGGGGTDQGLVIKFRGSNDGTNYTDIASNIDIPTNPNGFVVVDVTYSRFMMYATSGYFTVQSGKYHFLDEMQCYGREDV